MLVDIPNERGMADVDIEFRNISECRFPLFDFVSPLPAEWMVVLYAIMFLGDRFFHVSKVTKKC